LGGVFPDAEGAVTLGPLAGLSGFVPSAALALDKTEEKKQREFWFHLWAPTALDCPHWKREAL